jgi:phospholipid/cholesterol/gamma-HCH transport system substrate-binding protein
MQSAWKVGALVLVFAAMVIGILSILNTSLFAKPKATYFAEFPDAGGVTAGSDVLLAGVSIGQVTDVKLASNGNALVQLAVNPEVVLPRKLIAILPSSFISIGDRQILLQPLRNQSGNYSINDQSDPIPGQLKGPLEDILPNTDATMEELNKTMASFRTLLEDKELRQGLVAIMKSGEQTSTKFGKLADNLNTTLVNNSDEINAMMKGMVATMKNVQEVSAELNDFAKKGTLQNETERLFKTLNAAAEEGQLLVADLRKYTNDPEIQDNLKSTLSNFETMSQSGVKIAGDVEVMTKNGIEISDQTAKLMTKANKVAEEVEKLVEDIKKAVGKFDAGGGASGLIPKVEVESDLTFADKPSRLRADVNLKLPVGKDKLIFGLYDAFESNKLNVMLEKTINPRTDLRYGVYASKPGVGVSYAVAPNTWIQSQLFGLNDPQFDLRLKRRFNETLHGYVGLENVFGRNRPSIGVGIKQ